MLTGCVGSTSGTTAGSTQGTAATTAASASATTTQGFAYTGQAPVVEKMTKITWLATNSGSLDFDWKSKIWIHELCKNANIEIDMELIDNSVYQDTVLPRIAAGNLPDVVQIPVNDANMMYAKSGKFMDLTAFYDQYGYNIKNDFERNPTLRGQLTTPDNKMYFFPSLVPGMNGPICLMITMPYLKQLGLEVPTTLTEFYNDLVLFRDNDMNGDGDKTDEVPLFIRPARLKQLAGMWGIDLTSGYTPDKSGKLSCSFISEEYRAFLTYFNKLLTEGLMNKDFLSANYDIQTNLYANNRIGVMSQFAGVAVNTTMTFNPDWNRDTDELIVEPIMPLKGASDTPFYMGRDSFGERFAINAKCDEQTALAAFCFMDYCMSKEAYLLHNFGHEGESYKLDANGYVLDVENADVTENADKYGSWFKGIPDNEGLCLPYSGKAFDKINAQLSTATRAPVIVFSYMTEQEIETSNKYDTDLKTYVDEAMTGFITGTTSMSAWDDYVATCKKLHADDLTVVKQSIYDRLN